MLLLMMVVASSAGHRARLRRRRRRGRVLRVIMIVSRCATPATRTRTGRIRGGHVSRRLWLLQ